MLSQPRVLLLLIRILIPASMFVVFVRRRVSVPAMGIFVRKVVRGNDQEFGWDEVEFSSQGEETRVQRRLGFCLFEGFAMVEICVCKDAPEAPGEG